MKRIFALGTVVTLIAVTYTACNTPRPGTAGRPITLFNGKNLEGWDHVLAKPNVPREAVWSVRDEPNTRTNGAPRISLSSTNQQELASLLQERFGTDRANQVLQQAGGARSGFSSVLEFYARSGLSL